MEIDTFWVGVRNPYKVLCNKFFEKKSFVSKIGFDFSGKSGH